MPRGHLLAGGLHRRGEQRRRCPRRGASKPPAGHSGTRLPTSTPQWLRIPFLHHQFEHGRGIHVDDQRPPRRSSRISAVLDSEVTRGRTRKSTGPVAGRTWPAGSRRSLGLAQPTTTPVPALATAFVMALV
jgi:hypothetical protein